ncbi:MAG: MFS transporter [Anaerorhabdus sp.]
MEVLTRKIKIFYALGQLGWSMLASISGTWFIYFFLPPEGANINVVIPQEGMFLGFTLIGLIMGIGTLVDALSGPYIANISDKSNSPLGRRIPFLRKSALPFSLFLVLSFCVPYQAGIHTINIVWLLIVFPLYFLAFSAYVIPYTALLGELGQTTEDRIDLSTYISVTWFIGFVIPTFASNIWDLLIKAFNLPKTNAIQITFIILATIAFFLMLIPAYTIDEKKYCRANSSKMDMKSAVKSVIKNVDFKYFLYSEFGYCLANTLFQTSLVYYITVLAGLSENNVGLVVTIVGILSFLMYPMINKLSKKYGKKTLMVISLVTFIISFVYIALMGKLPFGGFYQLIPVIILSAIPAAISGVLPNAITADCAVYDAKESSENKEALYFGVRSFIGKIGNAISIVILPSILMLGKSSSNDIGIRLSVIFASFAALFSLLTFMKYNEKRILEKID